MTNEAIDALDDHVLVHDSVIVHPSLPPVSNPGGLINLSTRFDEFSLVITISYRGTLLEPNPFRPSADEVLEEEGQLRLARFLVGRVADRAKAERPGDLCIPTLSLENYLPRSCGGVRNLALGARSHTEAKGWLAIVCHF